MRQITQDAINAFMSDSNFKRSNTKVEVIENYKAKKTVLKLHGNTIAVRVTKRRTGDKSIYLTNAGWSSVTTKERLNGIPGIDIYQKDFVWYINNKEWNGNWCKYNPSLNQLKLNVAAPVL